MQTPKELEALFKVLRFSKGKWKRKSEASKMLGISRPTIDKILKRYPTGLPQQPKKTLPKYYEKWEQTEMVRKIKELFTDRATGKMTGQGLHVNGVLREAWRARGQKDPMDFTIEDYLFFFGTHDVRPYPDFVDPLTNKIAFHNAVALRVPMRINKDPEIKGLVDDPRFITKGLKREAGRRKHMYLEPHQIIKLVGFINEPDTLILLYLGILMGGRFSAFARLRVDNIHRTAQYLDLYEPKVKKNVEKDLWEFALNFLWRYIEDYDRKNLLFHYDLDEYNKRLTLAGKEALPEVTWALTTHVTLKHTCITLMSLHGVSVDVISDYVGTDAKTVIDFYRGGGREKIRTEILGLPTKPPKTWKQLWEELTPYFVQRYDYIKPFATTVDGIKIRLPPQAVRS